ncbi:MAG: hypothetical protein Q4G52_08350 [Clostridia bacterium]|nr:hypothetical protein [Clostridia bacterium]
MIKRRGLSVSAAASELGFSSKTALFRILNGQSKSASNRRCMEAACASELFALTDEETAMLKRALRVGEMGKQAFAMNELMRNLLHPHLLSGPLPAVPLTGGECGDLSALFAERMGFSGIRIGILGRCPQSVLALLHRFSEQADVSGICHIFAVDDQSTEHMRVLSEASFVLFSPVYSAYVINETGVQEKNWLFHSGIILISGVEEGDRRKTHLLTPVQGGYHLIVSDRGEPDALFERLVFDARERIRPLKQAPKNTDGLAFPDNYIQFTDSYEQIERGREIYMMKPDMPFNCIPPELLLPIVKEAFWAMEPSAQMAQAIGRLYDIQKARFDNLFGKKKVTHMVLNQDAMRRFATTGIREDHFFMIRPYTPRERVWILENLRDQMSENPYFHVWFGRSPDLVSDKEVTAYEGYGVAIIKSDTSWHLEADHREIMLESRALVSSFKDYMLNEILPEEVFSREQSLRILSELIELAGKE